MMGVPVSKIDDKSDYWEKNWNTYDSIIRQIDIEIAEANEAMRVIHCNKMQSLRETRKQLKEPQDKCKRLEGRRKAIEDHIVYFDSCPINPNQLLSKEFVVGNGLIVDHTLRNLRSILGSIQYAYNLGVTIAKIRSLI